MINKKKGTKIAKVPRDVWDERKCFSQLWGFNNAIVGFRLKDKLISGDFKATRKSKRKAKYVWEIEVELD